MEKEWLVTLATCEVEDLDFTDYVECARQLLPSLQVLFIIAVAYTIAYISGCRHHYHGVYSYYV